MSTVDPAVVLVAAVADNGVIGADGGIPWSLPGEQAHFRRLTEGHALVMGRATYDSIGRPLPRRRTVVVTRQRGWRARGHAEAVEVCHDLPSALAAAGRDGQRVFVVGGAAVYAEAMPLAGAMVLTHVHQHPAGDTRFPEIDPRAWREVDRQAHAGWTVVTYERTGDR